MKKNRKLVALVTMLMFAISIFAPMAAFAAEDGATETDVSYQASVYEVDQDDLKVDVNDKVNVKITSLDASGKPSEDQLKDIFIWAEETANQASDAMEVKENEDFTAEGAEGEKGVYKLNFKDDKTTGSIDVTFQRAGTYKIYVGTGDATDVKELTKLKVSGKYTVEVDAATNKVEYAKVKDEKLALTSGKAKENLDNDKQPYVKGLKANGIASEKVTVTLYDGNDDTVGQGVNVKFRATGNLKLNKTNATTDYAGKVDFKVSNEVSEVAYVYVDAGSYTGVIAVDSTETDVENIKVLKSGKDIDRDSTKWDTPSVMKDFIKFGTYNKNDQDVDGTDQEFNKKNKDYVKFTKQPAGADYEVDKDFNVEALEDSNSEFTITFEDKTPKLGDYNLRVALENGKTIDIPFTVSNFGDAKELVLDYDVTVVTPGDVVDAPDIKVIDKNGVERTLEADEVTLGYVGKAVEYFKEENTENGKVNGAFKVKEDADYGEKIVVTAVSEKYGLVAKQEFVVSQDGRLLKFANDNGKVGELNKVDFQIVDADGNKASLRSDYKESAIVVVESSNEDAVISTNIDLSKKGDLRSKGEGTLELTATAPTKATFAVYIKDDQNRYYAGNLTYNFGKKDIAASEKIVAFTINSNTMIDDNKTVEIDAPAVIKEARTFVPYRALGEAFGAKVEWDSADKTVTYELGSDKVVMTVGSTKYTINGEEKTMDVAPYISNSRTMVPARFVTEALGFTITPIKGDNGIATVVISID